MLSFSCHWGIVYPSVHTNPLNHQISLSSLFVFFWQAVGCLTHERASVHLRRVFFFIHNWFVSHNERVIRQKWVSVRASWSATVFQNSYGGKISRRSRPRGSLTGIVEGAREEKKKKRLTLCTGVLVKGLKDICHFCGQRACVRVVYSSFRRNTAGGCSAWGRSYLLEKVSDVQTGPHWATG